MIQRGAEGVLRWLAACENALVALGTAIFAFITLAICAEVLLRYGFDSPIAWVDEISEYALLWITFLGTSWVLRSGGHVRVDLLLQFLSPAALRICGLISSASGMLTSLVLVVFGASVTLTAMERGSFKPTTIEVPTWMVLVVIPVGGMLLFLRFMQLFLEYHRRTREFGADPNH